MTAAWDREPDVVIGTCKHGTTLAIGSPCSQCAEESNAAVVAPMQQWAPYPTILDWLVQRTRYRTGWRFKLVPALHRDDDHGRGTAGGLTLDIITATANAYRPAACERCQSVVTDYHVHHYFIVPAATYNQQSWTRWLFNRIVDVETHEAMEFFALEVDVATEQPASAGTVLQRPYGPTHGPGDDPYTVKELATPTQQRTSFRGTVKG